MDGDGIWASQRFQKIRGLGRACLSVERVRAGADDAKTVGRRVTRAHNLVTKKSREGTNRRASPSSPLPPSS